MDTTIIYTVDDVVFKVNGESLPVNHVRLDLALNTIPSFSVDLPPTKFDSSLLKIGSPSLQDAKNLLSVCFDWANQRAKCELKVELSNVETKRGAKSNQVKLELKDWILGDVSLGATNTTTGYMLSLRVYHPAFNMTKFGLFSDGIDGEIDIVSAGRDNIVDTADSVFNKISDALSSKPQKAPGDTVSTLPHASSISNLFDLAKQIQSDAVSNAAPSKYLQFKGGGLPLSDVRTILSAAGLNGDDAVKAAMATTCIPYDGASTWDTCVEATEIWGCTIIPTYNEQKLTVVPTEPWLEPELTVNDSQIQQLVFPAFDSNPILGVKCSNPLATSIDGTSHAAEDAIDGNLVGTWCYIPQGVLGEDGAFLAHGKLTSIGTPPWHTAIQEAAASLRPFNISGSSHGKEGVMSGVDSSLLSALYAGQIVYAAYIFQLLFKQTFTSSFTGPVIIDVTGGVLIPGKSMSIKEDGKTVFNGYVIGATHDFNVSSSTATTSVTLSYCRNDGGYKDVCEEGDRNPIYK